MQRIGNHVCRIARHKAAQAEAEKVKQDGILPH